MAILQAWQCNDLSSGLPRTNPASGQCRTSTRGLLNHYKVQHSGPQAMLPPSNVSLHQNLYEDPHAADMISITTLYLSTFLVTL